MSETALLLTAGRFADLHAKTAHGLLRGPSRYRLLGVLDPVFAGRDAGEVLDGQPRGVPCFADLDAALAALAGPPDWLVVGIAVAGGRLPEAMHATLLDAARRGIGLVNGLHQLLADDPEIAAAAARSGARLLDIRKPRPFAELRFWSGEVLDLAVPRIAVLGTDCALGKRTTATLLQAACRRRGLATELVTTGQTGWLQGHPYGFLLDATPNDFVSGELERAILDCARQAAPDLILIEGQSALRNPSGPCGAELLLSAGARGVVLQHAPGRPYFEGFEERRLAIPPLADEIDLIERYGAEVLGVALNGEASTDAELRTARARLANELQLPVVLPLHDGVANLIPAVESFVRSEAESAVTADSAHGAESAVIADSAHGAQSAVTADSAHGVKR